LKRLRILKLTASLAATILAVWAVVYIAQADLSALSNFDLDWPLFVLVIPMYLVITVARGARIKVMTGARESLWLLTGISAMHVFITKVFPFRTGEFFLPLMLKKHKVMGFARGSGILLAIRLIDFICLFAALFVSSFFVRKDYFEQYWGYISAAFLICLVPLIFTLALVVKGSKSRLIPDWNLPPSMRRISNWLNGLFSGPEGPGKAENSGDGANAGEGTSKQGRADGEGGGTPALARGPQRVGTVLAGGLLCSAISWLFVFASFYCLLEWAGVTGLTFPHVILGSAGAVIAGFLPINTLLSLGTIEAGWTASLYLVGVDPKFGAIVGFRMHVAIFFFNILFALLGMLVLQVLKRRREATGQESDSR